LEIVKTPFSGLVVLEPKRPEDGRGFFCETYNKQRLAGAGIDLTFVQQNLSLSKKGTIRGLHFQSEPMAQAKLVSVVRGAVCDIVVDLRRSSETYGRHFKILLDETRATQLFVPTGFAHGFLALQPDTLFLYSVSNYYSPRHEGGIQFDDPTLDIDWGVDGSAATLSDRDRALPRFDRRALYFP
jgi:dTDP-4-dehydrorhamnose 3,5-epimerase